MPVSQVIQLARRTKLGSNVNIGNQVQIGDEDGNTLYGGIVMKEYR